VSRKKRAGGEHDGGPIVSRHTDAEVVRKRATEMLHQFAFWGRRFSFLAKRTDL
jgi:hypothetical protein